MEGRRRQASNKIVICVAGLPGCGKSSLAKRLAEHYGLKYASGGEALKALAAEAGYRPTNIGWWESEEGMKFLRQRMEDLSFDKKVDEELLKLAKGGGIVLDSWTMPWLFKEGFNVWLEASLSVRVKRVAKRDGISYEEAAALVKDKEKGTKSIYERLYGFRICEDYSPFDLIVDTDLLSAEEVFQVVRSVVDSLIFRAYASFTIL